MLALLRTIAGTLGLAAKRCAVCNVVIHSPGEDLCLECDQEISLRHGGVCPTCGLMSGLETAPPSQCPECRHAPPPWDRLYFHGRYTGTLRDLILGYKFSGQFGRTRLLANMANKAFSLNDGQSPDVIVPVPLHPKRLLWRGFNQAAEISRPLSKKMGIPILTHGLQRNRNTPPQTRLGLEERQANIKDAFTADTSVVANKRVLLVDDVYTTGATLRECTRTLKRAGATGVEVLVLARTQQEP